MFNAINHYECSGFLGTLDDGHPPCFIKLAFEELTIAVQFAVLLCSVNFGKSLNHPLSGLLL